MFFAATLTFSLVFAHEARRLSERAQPVEIRLGERVEGTLAGSDPVFVPGGRARVYEFRSLATGPVTVGVESYDFDAFAHVETKTVDPPKFEVHDDDSGVETNSLLRFQARRDVSYRIFAGSSDGGVGEFSLSVASGTRLAATGKDLLWEAVAFRRTAADRALARGDRARSVTHRLRLGHQLSSLASYDFAEVALVTALDLANELGDRRARVEAYRSLGYVALGKGDFDRAGERFQALFDAARACGDFVAEEDALCNLAALAERRGRFEEARGLHTARLSLAKEHDDSVGEASSLRSLGHVFLALGKPVRARGLFESAVEHYRRLEDDGGELEALQGLADALLRVEDTERARTVLKRALSHSRNLRDRPAEERISTTLRRLGSSEVEKRR